VLGIAFEGGVAIAADILCSYGSLARFRDCPRVMHVNDNIILGAGGDYADFQYLKDVIEQKM
jgi:20S proteasome subunit beta 7